MRRHECSNNGSGVRLLGGGDWLLGILLSGGVGVGLLGGDVGVELLGIGGDIGLLGVGIGIIGCKSRQFVIGKQIDLLDVGFFGWWWNYTSIVFRRTISWFLENYSINVSKTK